MEATADDSLAAIRARSKFGIAIAAMIRMMATTISNSISEKPFSLLLRMHGTPFRLNFNVLLRGERCLQVHPHGQSAAKVDAHSTHSTHWQQPAYLHVFIHRPEAHKPLRMG